MIAFLVFWRSYVVDGRASTFPCQPARDTTTCTCSVTKVQFRYSEKVTKSNVKKVEDGPNFCAASQND